MIREILPSLFLIRPENPPAQTQFTYLLRRPDGNILFATKADISPFMPELDALGGVAHMLLGDRHHGGPHTADLAARLGLDLCCSEIEAKALGAKGVKVGRPLPHVRSWITPDLEAVPTPGHTKGAFSYLAASHGRKLLFIGDTLVPIDGRWDYWVAKPNRPEMRRTLQTLKGLEFDVIVSNSFAATPAAWIESDREYRRAMFEALEASLSE